MKMKKAMEKRGVAFLADTYTNQIFPILNNHLIEILSKRFEFYVWKKINEEYSAVRLITSWNTSDIAVREFIEIIESEMI